jgi:hypothetical protein
MNASALEKRERPMSELSRTMAFQPRSVLSSWARERRGMSEMFSGQSRERRFSGRFSWLLAPGPLAGRKAAPLEGENIGEEAVRLGEG